MFGFVDWFAIRGGTRAKSIGLNHGLGNVVVVVLFAASWLVRYNDPNYYPGTLGLMLSFAGILLGMVTGWLGGGLVDRLGVGVDRGANLNSPSSLSGQPADGTAPGYSRRMAPQTGDSHEEEKR